MGRGHVPVEFDRMTKAQKIRHVRIQRVVRLVDEGKQYREIADEMHMSYGAVWAMHRDATTEGRRVGIEESAWRRLATGMQKLIDELEIRMVEAVSKDGPLTPADEKIIDLYNRTAERQTKFYGFNPPTVGKIELSMAQKYDRNDAIDVAESGALTVEEALLRQAVWARKTQAINVNGYLPALPPGMTAPAAPTRDTSNDKRGLDNIWDMMADYPDDTAE
jgi:hypothetical protein